MQTDELPAPFTKPTRVYYIVDGSLSLIGDKANFEVCMHASVLAFKMPLYMHELKQSLYAICTNSFAGALDKSRK
jgi:hypothetical protein